MKKPKNVFATVTFKNKNTNKTVAKRIFTIKSNDIYYIRHVKAYHCTIKNKDTGNEVGLTYYSLDKLNDKREWLNILFFVLKLPVFITEPKEVYIKQYVHRKNIK